LNDDNDRKRWEALPRNKRVKLERPRAAAKPKEEKKFVSRSQVRRAASENNISESDAAAAFVSKGYRIVN
jgi:hypothetical protein